MQQSVYLRNIRFVGASTIEILYLYCLEVFFSMIKITSTIPAVILFLSGCMSIPDPVVIGELNNAKNAQYVAQPSKVLLIFDVSPYYYDLENSADAEKARKYMDERVDASYGNVAKQGIKADYVIHSSHTPINFPTSGYSHMLVESLNSFTRGGHMLPSETWEANLFEMSDTSSRKPLFIQTYRSQSMACYGPQLLAKKEECKSKYIGHLLGHLSPLGITNKVVVEDPAQTQQPSSTH